MPDKMSQREDRAAARLRRRGGRLPDQRRARGPRELLLGRRAGSTKRSPARSPEPVREPGQPAAHYETTGPEIWEQVGDELDVLVAGVGTGGTITGVGALPASERLPALEIVGADPEGSIYNAPEVRPYLDRGRRRGLLADDVRPAIVDRWITVSDRDAFLAARRLAREEGILIGGSAGMALHAALEVPASSTTSKTVLVLLPDGGRPYLSKMFNDNWMIEHGLLERPAPVPTVAEILRPRRSRSRTCRRWSRSAPSSACRRGDQPAAAVRRSRRCRSCASAATAARRPRPTSSARSRSASCSTGSSAKAPTRCRRRGRRRDGAAAVRSCAAEQRVDQVIGDLQERPAVVVADGDRPTA